MTTSHVKPRHIRKKRFSLLSHIEKQLNLHRVNYLGKGERLLRITKALFIRPHDGRNQYLNNNTDTPEIPIRVGLIKRLITASHAEFVKPIERFADAINLQWLLTTRWVRSKTPISASAANISSAMLILGEHINRQPYLILVAMCASIALGLLVTIASLSLLGQSVFVVVAWLVATQIKKLPRRLANLGLMAVTLLVLSRYIFWRITQTMDLDTGIETILGYTLLIAETYTWMVLIFGFIQTAWPLERKPKTLPPDFNTWPSVDVLIPTYNEPLSVVKPTVYAAKGMDWPTDKVSIYLLDDGKRPEFAAFAQQAGIEYVTRTNNSHAKAGNINHALEQTHGEYVAIFDCDHIPTRSFLQVAMGWFLADPQCAMVQTPHHFFSADPFERNFNAFREMPNEGTLFYGLIQDGNDFWNAAFFCGSCAIIRRKPLMEIGGIAVETVTEDAHTALKLHRKGYNTGYIRIVQAAGLATESLAGHIGQRIRWARGMAQIFRLDNPFLGKGLSFFQRICYGNAMLHFFNGIPRVLFLLMPMAYLFFELHLLNASAGAVLCFVLPTLIIASYSNSKIQGDYRHSFWSEVYETVLSWYILLPTTMAFINPKLVKFNVTTKGGLIEKEYFDTRIATPYLILLGINLLGFGFGLLRLFVWNTHETGAVILNLSWCIMNLIILGAAVGVASESVQRQIHHRVRMVIPAILHLPGGYTVACYTQDYSAGGLGIALPIEVKLADDTKVMVGLNRGDREFLFPAQVANRRDNILGVRFNELSPEHEMQLIQCTFGRADTWLNWNDTVKSDKALRSLGTVALTGIKSYGLLIKWMARGASSATKRLLTTYSSKFRFNEP
jgi:cellulose synthase (UDP-forming)